MPWPSTANRNPFGAHRRRSGLSFPALFVCAACAGYVDFLHSACFKQTAPAPACSPRLAAVQVVCLGARRRHRLSWAATPPRHAGAAPTCNASLPVRCRMVRRLLSGERPQAFYEQIADHDSAARRVSAVPFSTPNIDAGAISRSHAVPSSGHRSRLRTRFRTRSRMATRMGVNGCLLTCTAQRCRKAGMSQKDQTATLQQSCAA